MKKNDNFFITTVSSLVYLLKCKAVHVIKKTTTYMMQEII